MGTKINYPDFLNQLDQRLENYFRLQKDFIRCKIGCSNCCKKGDYPLSLEEMKYLMLGFQKLLPDTKIKVQENIKNTVKGGQCPFLINDRCSVYLYRPIICRVHGLAYLCKNNTVKLPYCVNENMNFSKVYNNGEFLSEPIKENLDTQALISEYDFGEIRNLLDWIKTQQK